MSYTLVPVHDCRGDQPHLIDVWLKQHTINHLRQYRGADVLIPPRVSVAAFDPQKVAEIVEIKRIHLRLSWEREHGLSHLISCDDPVDVLEWAKHQNAQYWHEFWRG